MGKRDNSRAIPFGKPAKVGNFKLWRSWYSSEIQQINISDAAGGWHVAIPMTYEMFNMISYLFEEEDGGSLILFLSNMMFVSSIPNGYYHMALNTINAIYSDPRMLTDEKEFADLKKNADALIKSFLEWRRVYDEKMKEMEPTEKEDEQDELAEKAAGLLDDDGGSSPQ